MYIRKLRIVNFRGIALCELTFEKGMNFLIGANNIGKSTILESINMLLNPDIQWWKPDLLNEYDFHFMQIKKEIKIESILICDDVKNCHPGDDGCKFFDLQGELCALKDYTLRYDSSKGYMEDAYEFPSLISDQEGTLPSLPLAVYIRFTAKINESDDSIENHTEIFGPDGEWHNLTRKMRQSISVNFYSLTRTNPNSFKMGFRSLLANFIPDLNQIQKSLSEKFAIVSKEITDVVTQSHLKPLFSEEKTIQDEFQKGGKLVLGTGEIFGSGLLRQLELCLEVAYDSKTVQIPISRQGEGLQKLLILYLTAKKHTTNSTRSPIILLEEPEQNLEPQRQRTLIKLLNRVCGDSQLIITTHSPFVLSPILNLTGVQRLYKVENNVLSVNLGKNKVGRKDFEKLKKIVNGVELFEILFGKFIVVWEGETDIVFFHTLMNNLKDFPAEWLRGISANGISKIIPLMLWLKQANYTVISVLDGDEPNKREQMKINGLDYIILPDDVGLERLIKHVLDKNPSKISAPIVAKSICASDLVTESGLEKWPWFKTIFNEICHERGLVGGARKIPGSDLLAKFEEKFDPEDEEQLIENLVMLLKMQKSNNEVYECLASELSSIPEGMEPCNAILDTLKECWIKTETSRWYFDGSFQLMRDDSSGTISRSTSSP